jgi:hypothetical protein
LANGEAKPNAEKSPEKMAMEQDKVPKAMAVTKKEARTNS